MTWLQIPRPNPLETGRSARRRDDSAGDGKYLLAPVTMTTMRLSSAGTPLRLDRVDTIVALSCCVHVGGV
jgi:hypothetical protein